MTFGAASPMTLTMMVTTRMISAAIISPQAAVAAQSMCIPELHVEDRVCQSIAGDSQPASAAGRVIPQLVVRTGRIVPQVNGLEEMGRLIRRAPGRAPVLRISQERKFVHIALAAEWTSDLHGSLPEAEAVAKHRKSGGIAHCRKW
jgi:hypothetical protein